MKTLDDPRSTGRQTPRPSPLRALAGVATATAGVLVLLVVARASGASLLVQVATRPPQEVTAGAAVFAVLVSGVCAWGAAVLATRVASRPRTAFVTTAVLALTLSLIPPVAAATGATVWWLEAMHVLVFAAVVSVLAPAVPSRREGRVSRPSWTLHRRGLA